MSHLGGRTSSYKKFVMREQVEEDQKFDYTRGENSEYNNSMFGAARGPNQGSPWAFIDVINPKKHALAIAKELDNQRGVPTDNSKNSADDSSEASNNSDTVTNTNSSGSAETFSSQSTIRRLPSGAKPTTNGHAIQETTPVRQGTSNPPNPNDQSLSDVVGQSTPLALGKNDKPNFQNASERANKDYDGSAKETHWLREEIARLKDRLLQSESQIMEKEAKVSELNEFLQNTLKEKKSSIDILQDELKELKEQWLLDNEKKENEMNETRRMEQKSQETVQELKRTQQIERDSLVEKLTKLDNNWNQTLDKEKQKLMKEMDMLEAEYDKKTNEFQENLEQKIRQLGVSDEALRNKTQELDSLQKDFCCRNEELAEFKEKLESKTTELSLKCKELNEMQSECVFLRKDLHRGNGELTKIKENLEGKNTELTEKCNELNELQSECASLRKDFHRQKNESARLKENLESKTAELVEKSEKLLEIQSGFGSLQKDFHAQTKELVEFKKILQDKGAELTEKSTELDKIRYESRQKENNLKNDLKAKDCQIRELSQYLEQKDKEFEVKYSAKNDEFLCKSKEFDLLQESKKEISVVKSQLDVRLRKFEFQNKKKEEFLQNQRSSYEEQLKKLKQTVEDERKKNKDLSVNMEELDQFAQEFSQYVEDLELFGIKLGDLIVDTFKKSHVTKNLDPFFINAYKDVVGFHKREHDNFYREMESKISALELRNKELIIQIEHQWKSKLENEHQELEQRKSELKQLHEKFKTTEQKYATLQTKVETYQEEKAIILKEKESVLQNNITLSEEIANYRSNLLSKDQERFLELISKVEKQSQLITKLQGSETELESLRKQLDRESSQLQQLQGDPSRKITFAAAHRSRPDINSTIYENLMVGKVDSIDMVELQNIVKNLILLLDIPFNKLTKKSPLVAIYLKYERPIFTHFANRLHYQLFNEPIDMKRFANDAYDQYSEDHDMRSINHPLQGCLDNLYQRIISKISRR